MKRIVMLLVFALVVPTLGFSNELDKNIQDIQKEIESLEKDRSEEYKGFNKNNSQTDRDDIAKQINMISEQIERMKRQKRLVEETKNDISKQKKAIEDQTESIKKWRLGIIPFAGCSFLGNTNERHISWGGDNWSILFI